MGTQPCEVWGVGCGVCATCVRGVWDSLLNLELLLEELAVGHRLLVLGSEVGLGSGNGGALGLELDAL